MDFIPALPVLAAYAIACIALALTPGPDMTLFLGKTLTQSRFAGVVTLAGALTGLVFHTLVAALGLSALLAASATAFTMLKIAGAAYLAWLAWQAIRHGSAFTPARAKSAPESWHRLFATGLGINLLNPKIIVFFVTFLPQFVSPDDPHASGKLVFLGFGFIVICAPICVAMILAADRIADALRRSPRIMRVIDCVFAAVLGGFALRLLVTRAG